MPPVYRFVAVSLAMLAASAAAAEPPHVLDRRLTIELFAEAPRIVHPISLAVDARGRLLAIESHTHFSPDDYGGPKHDRILALEDTDGDGRAETVSTFFEGTTHTMDIAAHRDGSIYVATRNEVFRLRDDDGDGRAEQRQRIVFLDTEGNYPHNGLSGLEFDFEGNLYFGMGENLGAAYTLIGADGATISDQGEGGNVFWCTHQGNHLRRVATGFWNPFGACRDIYDRLIVTDNDPSLAGCRLVHVTERGDYGYQYRYGRSGLHPFISWNGQLSGTLPMIQWTGEAPCEVISYESDALPRDYLGNLLVACWGEHRIERFALAPRGASYGSQRSTVVQGGEDFRPVGIAVAPDGSLYVSDWVKRDYQLHGQGRIWHIKPRRAASSRSSNRRDVYSLHRPTRERAVRDLLRLGGNAPVERLMLSDVDERFRAAAVSVLSAETGSAEALLKVASGDGSAELRAMAIRGLLKQQQYEQVRPLFENRDQPAVVRLAALPALNRAEDGPELVRLLAHDDPFVRSAAIAQLAEHPRMLQGIDATALDDPVRRIGVMLAHRRSGPTEPEKILPPFLRDPESAVRFMAIKWIADEKLTQFGDFLRREIQQHDLSPDMFLAYATAIARLEDRPTGQRKLAAEFSQKLIQGQVSAALKARMLRSLPSALQQQQSGEKKPTALKIAHLRAFLESDHDALRLETVRYLASGPDQQQAALLMETARDSRFAEPIRAFAVVGLAHVAEQYSEALLELAEGESAALRDEALRALVGVELSAAQRSRVEKVARSEPSAAELAARVLDRPFIKDRPTQQDRAGWLARLDGPADAEAGRRVFFHPKLARCAACHTRDGRGANVGPDLTLLARQNDRAAVLQSILQPSQNVAPHYAAWNVATVDGKTFTGILVRQSRDGQVFVDNQGGWHELENTRIDQVIALPISMMPEGLLNLLTDREARDLLAYLSAR